jgi:hypothetical protein
VNIGFEGITGADLLLWVELVCARRGFYLSSLESDVQSEVK